MPRAKSPRTVKPKAENKVLQMPENGNGQAAHSARDLEPEIRLRAYELYQQRGPNPGSEKDDWLLAEREVLARYANQTHTA
ncbi:MAG TPA: DUF2934 domain-containing protein [Terriglobales bacterium]|nr:DUF2934 domain-containing protein [Terriglobales bacterium]